jgi:deazaflavin-dependent oxidoreductase (nitroreductase family)
MKKIAKALLVILGLAVATLILDTALHLWSWRSRSPRSLHVVKRYNKHLVNPVMLQFSGRFGSSAVIHHVGRRSGTPYATPVVAHQANHDVIIPLPYGTEVDWLRNLLAAGQGVVDLEGRSLEVDEPAVVDIEDVIDLLPASMVRTVRFNGSREAVQMRVSGLALSEPA